ncbi:MAG: isoaspartyl peptidase/L-asparaginase [Bifidobacterium bifidum]
MIITTVSGASTASGSPVNGILLAIHAGAGDRSKDGRAQKTAQAERDLRRALDAGYALLEQGAPAEDTVCAAIHVMEDAPEFNAGRGAALTSEGKVSMDACLMTGDGEVGSAAGLTTARHPIDVARAVKERTKHTMFTLPGEDCCCARGASNAANPSYFVTGNAGVRPSARAQSEGDAWEKHGTIGAVARDAAGHVAGPGRHQTDAGARRGFAAAGCGGVREVDDGVIVSYGYRRAFVVCRGASNPRIVCGSPASQCRGPLRPHWMTWRQTATAASSSCRPAATASSPTTARR